MIGSIPLRPARRRKTGYVWDERYLFHDPGFQTYGVAYLQPFRAYDNPTPKHRLHSLVGYSGLLDVMTPVRARKATVEVTKNLRSHPTEWQSYVHIMHLCMCILANLATTHI